MRLLILLVVVLLLYFLCLHLSGKLSRRPSKAKKIPPACAQSRSSPQLSRVRQKRVPRPDPRFVFPRISVISKRLAPNSLWAAIGCNASFAEAMIRQQVGFRDADPEAASKNVRRDL